MATIEIPPTLIPTFLASCEELTIALRKHVPDVSASGRRTDDRAILHAVESIDIPFSNLVGATGKITLQGAVLLTRWINENGLFTRDDDERDADK